MTDGHYNWDFGSKAGFVMSHVSEYDPLDAFYELTKNGEDAHASSIHMDFDTSKKRIIIYDDGEGMSESDLSHITRAIGKSRKGEKNHGVGLMAFLRIAKRMIIFTKRQEERKPSVVACEIVGEKIVSDLGNPREASSSELLEYDYGARKLNRAKQGTVVILEGVGSQKTSHFDFQFDMKERFEQKKFESWFKRRGDFNLKRFSYFTKFDTGKRKKLTAKIGSGTKVNFTVPSKEHPYTTTKGRQRYVFMSDGHAYELRVTFDLWVSSSHEGQIMVSERGQDFIEISLALKNCFKVHPRNSVFTRHEYNKYLRGNVDFTVKPLKGAPQINVYSGTRTRLLMDGSFGDCFANVLMYAEQEVIRPAVEKYVNKKNSMRDEHSTKELRDNMSKLYDAHPKFWEQIVATQNADRVRNQALVTCRSCGLAAVPIRGKLSSKTKIMKGQIYAFEDKTTYTCGTCRNMWPRRTVEVDPDKTGGERKRDTYTQPDPGSAKPRERKRGFGFSFNVCPFGHDNRRTRIIGTTVEVNSAHSDYRSLKKCKGQTAARHLRVYEIQQAVQAIVEHESENLSKKEAVEKLREGDALVLVWYNTERGNEPVGKKNGKSQEPSEDFATRVDKLKASWGTDK